MAKTRSPQYPIIGLKEAIDRAADAYKRDYQNAVPREVIAQHIGYQSLNGKSLGVLAALGKYGLIEGRGDQTRVTDLAVIIIAHPPGEPARVEGLREASQSPELFRELDEKFAGGRASDQALRSYLLTQKFIPSAAETAIRAYRETKAFVESEASGHDSPRLDAVTNPIPSQTQLPAIRPPSVVSPNPYLLQQEPHSAEESREPYEIKVTRKGLSFQGYLTSAAVLDEAIHALSLWRPILKSMEQGLMSKTSVAAAGAAADSLVGWIAYSSDPFKFHGCFGSQSEATRAVNKATEERVPGGKWVEYGEYRMGDDHVKSRTRPGYEELDEEGNA